MKHTYTASPGKYTVYRDEVALKRVRSEVAALLYCAERNGDPNYPQRKADERCPVWEKRKQVWAAKQIDLAQPKKVVPAKKKKTKTTKKKKAARAVPIKKVLNKGEE